MELSWKSSFSVLSYSVPCPITFPPPTSCEEQNKLPKRNTFIAVGGTVIFLIPSHNSVDVKNKILVNWN